MFVVIAFSAYDVNYINALAPFDVAGIGAEADTIFFSFIGLDTGLTAGDGGKTCRRRCRRN
ncbi:hypothetical protein A8144_12725 [Mycobacterium leprae 3125609]|nr:hypothetical protein [Mycobacterium leprae]OAR19962.1 hypothetical protein A8144_12725 [Mycobacterium leprae 3125609]OAX70324.1 hypothetical protein A3216_12575 [Mycobacterium leprae 7935681]